MRGREGSGAAQTSLGLSTISTLGRMRITCSFAVAGIDKELLRQFSASLLLLLDSEKLWIKRCLHMRWEIHPYCFLLLLPNRFSIIIIFVS